MHNSVQHLVICGVYGLDLKLLVRLSSRYCQHILLRRLTVCLHEPVCSPDILVESLFSCKRRSRKLAVGLEASSATSSRGSNHIFWLLFRDCSHGLLLRNLLLLPGTEPVERLALGDVVGLWLLCALLALLWRHWTCNRQAMLTKKALDRNALRRR